MADALLVFFLGKRFVENDGSELVGEVRRVLHERRVRVEERKRAICSETECFAGMEIPNENFAAPGVHFAHAEMAFFHPRCIELVIYNLQPEQLHKNGDEKDRHKSEEDEQTVDFEAAEGHVCLYGTMAPVQKEIFKNGLRLVTKKLASTQSVTVLILTGAGSRYETKKLNGISHFLEHMFFKGAKKYKTAKEVSEMIDGVGGDFNAFTGKEYVGYYVKVAARHQDVAMDVLSDMLIHSKFDPHEIDKERGVIMEEYNMYQDTPMYQVGWDFERLIYGDQPMGWDQVGTKELIHGVTRDDFVAYKKALYTPENLVISVAGRIDHDEVAAQVKKYFKFEDGKKAYEAALLEPNKSKEKVFLQHKKTEQAHVVVGFPAYHEEHEDHYAEKLLAVILGGGMSSRMFLSVREAKGLAYYVQTSTDDYTDTGIISTRAGVDVKRIKLAVTAILEEYKKIRGEKIPAAELKKAKEYLKGKLVLRLEDSEEYAHLIGKEELLYGKTLGPDEIMKKLDSVTAEDIARVSKDLFKPENARIAAIGPYEKKEEFEALL